MNRICPDKTGAAVHGAIETFGGLSEKQHPGGGGVVKSRQVVVGGFKCIFLHFVIVIEQCRTRLLS